jgi:hypothetical protein
MTDWSIFKGDGSQHDGLASLPDPPPWRFSQRVQKLVVPQSH